MYSILMENNIKIYSKHTLQKVEHHQVEHTAIHHLGLCTVLYCHKLDFLEYTLTPYYT